MKKSRGLIGSILLLFLMLWLPLGQQGFLVDHWMKIGTYAIPFMLMGVFLMHESNDFGALLKNYRFVGVLMLIAYITHQFEEHWIDLYGNYYAFYEFNNNFILGKLGAPDSPIRPLTKESIFIINTTLVWLVGILGILSSPKHLFPLIAMASIIIVNGLVHILAAIATLQYNPGLLTSVMVFIPLYFWFLRFILNQNKKHKKLIAGGIIWAFLAHIIMVCGLLMTNWFNLFSEAVYFVALVIWSVIPMALFRLKRLPST
ncbi:MAG: HXXEE domain-containing protein [Bacteroidota bacterium]